jgi:putative heme iron utilization protein
MRTLKSFALAVVFAACSASALGEVTCATPAQAQQVQAFYKQNPATMPVIAARRLQLAETVVVSGLPAEQAAGTSGAAFTDVWSAMTKWQNALFLIMKDENVFEILSRVGPAEPSKTSKYTNIAYEQPLRGHLRPDLYSAVYAVALPGKDGKLTRGVLFYDRNDALVFGVFTSGEALPEPPAGEVASFDALMKLIRERGAVCQPA